MFSWARAGMAMRNALYVALLEGGVLGFVIMVGVVVGFLWPELEFPAWLQAESHETWLMATLWWLSLVAAIVLTGFIWHYDRSLPLDEQRDAGWHVSPPLMVLFTVPTMGEVPVWGIALWIYGIITVLCYNLETTRERVKGFLRPKQPTLA